MKLYSPKKSIIEAILEGAELTEMLDMCLILGTVYFRKKAGGITKDLDLKKYSRENWNKKVRKLVRIGLITQRKKSYWCTTRQKDAITQLFSFWIIMSKDTMR